MTDIIKSNHSFAAAEIISPADAVQLHHSSGKKLFEIKASIPDQWLNEFQKDLLRLSKFLGIQNPPNPDELNSIVLFLCNNFADYTRAEIIHAFELYAAGKLQTIEIAGKHVPIEKPFGTFNGAFIGSVLNSYRIYRKDLLKRNEKPAPIERRLEESSLKGYANSPEEWQILNHRIILEYIIKNKALPLTGDYAAAFLYLEGSGDIKMNIEEKKEFALQIREKRIHELNKNRFMNPFKRFEIEKEIEQISDDRSPIFIKLLREEAAKIFYHLLLKDQK